MAESSSLWAGVAIARTGTHERGRFWYLFRPTEREEKNEALMV